MQIQSNHFFHAMFMFFYAPHTLYILLTFCEHIMSFTITFMFTCCHVLSDNVQLLSACHRNMKIRCRFIYALTFCSLAYDMIMSCIPSPSGSSQTTATSHSSFSNQPTSHYPSPTNLLPYNPFPPYFLPVHQPVLPSFYPQAYLSSYPYTIQQWNDPTHTCAPSMFPSPPSNPVHHNQQYIVHQNPSLSYEQYHLPSHSSGPSHPYHHRLSSQAFPLYSSTDPNSVTTAAATSHHSLNLPDVHSLTSQLSSMTTSRDVATAATSHLSLNLPDVHSLTSQLSSMTTSRDVATAATSYHSLNLPDVHSLTSQFSSITSSRKTPHTKQSTYQQSFPPHHPRQSYTSNCDSTISAHNSLASFSPPATTPSGSTASPSTPGHQHPLSRAMQRYVTYLKKVYTSINTPVYDKEHSLLQVKAKSFINIALVHKRSSKHMKDSDRNEIIMDKLHGHVDAIQRKKTKLSIYDVCKAKNGKPAHSVLVEGAPGVGKTTFANELCKRWARGKIMQEWAAVVLIKL